MRLTLVVLGALLIVVGVVLAVVPAIPQFSRSVSSAEPQYLNVTAGFSFFGPIPFSLRWTSSQPLWIFVLDCSQLVSGGALPSACHGLSVVGSENGTAGTFAFKAAPGDSILIFVPGAQTGTADVQVSAGAPILGSVLFVLGIALIILGVVWRRRTRPEPTLFVSETTTKREEATPVGA